MKNEINYKSVNVLATAGDEEGVYVYFNGVKLNGENLDDISFSLNKKQTKWLITALKQARDLAYK